MARTTSSKLPAPAPSRLYGSPPSRRLASPILAGARGHRLSLKLGVKTSVTAAPSPSKPSSAPSPLSANNKALRRTYSFLKPTAYGNRMSSSAPTTAGTTGAVTSSSSAQSDNDEDTTPITGVEIGSGVFRPINLTKIDIPIFDMPMPFQDFISLRLRLDSSDGGLTSEEFRDMFGECKGCDRYMMWRSKDHHRCPGKYTLPTLAPADRLFLLLDSTAGGQGLTKFQFLDLFFLCTLCGHVFTREAAANHFNYCKANEDSI